MESIDTSGKALVDHWKWAAEKGVMKSNTANALRAACTQVLGVLDGWEALDVRSLDVEDVYRRFQNKRNKDFKPNSLEAYRRRFAQAVKMFLDYVESPSTWKAPMRDSSTKERQTRREQNDTSAERSQDRLSATERVSATSIQSGLVEYPFPLREGRLAFLKLPIDLKAAEVRRLTAYLNTLAIDNEAA
jgi:hypothetical protein